MKSGKVHLKQRWWNSNDLNPKGNSELCFYQLQYSIYVDRCLKNMTPPLYKKYIYIENMPTTGSWHRLTVWTRNRLSSVSRNQTHTLPATNYWEQSVYKCKMAVSLIICTVPTGPNLTPKRTQTGPRVHFESAFKKSGSVRGSLWFRSGQLSGSALVLGLVRSVLYI